MKILDSGNRVWKMAASRTTQIGPETIGTKQEFVEIESVVLML